MLLVPMGGCGSTRSTRPAGRRPASKSSVAAASTRPSSTPSRSWPRTTRSINRSQRSCLLRSTFIAIGWGSRIPRAAEPLSNPAAQAVRGRYRQDSRTLPQDERPRAQIRRGRVRQAIARPAQRTGQGHALPDRQPAKAGIRRQPGTQGRRGRANPVTGRDSAAAQGDRSGPVGKSPQVCRGRGSRAARRAGAAEADQARPGHAGLRRIGRPPLSRRAGFTDRRPPDAAGAGGHCPAAFVRADHGRQQAAADGLAQSDRPGGRGSVAAAVRHAGADRALHRGRHSRADQPALLARGVGGRRFGRHGRPDRMP